jgi:hypothetical protein
VEVNHYTPIFPEDKKNYVIEDSTDTQLVAVVTEAAGSKPLEVNQKLNDIALFLAGMGIGEKSDIYHLTSSADYQQYAKNSADKWSSFDSKITVRVRAWVHSDIPDLLESRDVFYPFGGPDILHARIFFPNAIRYTLLGLEPVGAIPELEHKDKDTLKSYIAALDKSLANILRLSFFVTKDMNEDLTQLDGALLIMLLFLARTGSEIITIRPTQLDTEGNVCYRADFGMDVPRKHNPGVEITFKAKGEKIQRTVRYFSVDLSDESLTLKNRMRLYIDTMENGYVTFLKAASYLMHTDSFDSIRGTILDHSRFVLQDDSGIAYHDFNKELWNISLYGVYKGPIDSFKHQFEKDLLEAYADSSKPLRFRIGYGTQSNLLVARRIGL